MSYVNQEYMSFISSKHKRHHAVGFKPDTSAFPSAMKDWQAAVTEWAIESGRAGLFERPGLGKTIQQLTWSEAMHKYTNKPVLILAPLVVARQSVREAEKFGIDGVGFSNDGKHRYPITITNYEHAHKFDPSLIDAICLDESSILKAFMGKIKMAIMAMFCKTRFRLVASATPAPNDDMEMLNQADFLGIMPSNEALARWFINDTMAMGKYKIKPHARRDYWEWIASWAICMESPDDIGYEGSEFVLPPITRIEHLVQDHHDFSNGKLFPEDETISATNLYSQLRKTAGDRTDAAAEIVNNSDESWVVWCHTNNEADMLAAKIADSVNVYGSMKAEQKEKALSDFTNGNIRVMVTKPSMCGFGLNWQHACKQGFVGLSYSYEQLYQAEARLHRFGQTRPVESHLFMSRLEKRVYDAVSKKAERHGEMRRQMSNSISSLQTIRKKSPLNLSIKYEKKEFSGENWRLVCGDSVQEIEQVDDNSLDFCIHSPPFSSLYIYSDSAMDMGNCQDDAEFFKHYDFLIEKLYKKMRPGRLVAIHCKQLVDYKGRDGRAGLRDFRGEIIRHFEKYNFKYHSEVCIWKDPVIEMQRTKAHGLLHKQTKADSSFSRQGLPDYLVVMRKWAEPENESDVIPVRREKGFQNYVGENAPVRQGDSKRDIEGYSIHVWQRYASPVWFDIRQTEVLNKKGCKDDEDEKHICPLQLDVIERAVHLWSNPGELVYSPFAGRGSELYGAVKIGRKALGHELKMRYCEMAAKTMEILENSGKQLELSFE